MYSKDQKCGAISNASETRTGWGTASTHRSGEGASGCSSATSGCPLSASLGTDLSLSAERKGRRSLSSFLRGEISPRKEARKGGKLRVLSCTPGSPPSCTAAPAMLPPGRLGVGQVGPVGDVGGDGGAAAQDAVAAPGSSGPPARRRPPQRLGAVPQGHQPGGAAHHQPAAPGVDPPLRGGGGRGRGGRAGDGGRGGRRGRQHGQGLRGRARGQVMGEGQGVRVGQVAAGAPRPGPLALPLLLPLPLSVPLPLAVQLRRALVVVVLGQVVALVVRGGGGRGGGGRGRGAGRVPRRRLSESKDSISLAWRSRSVRMRSERSFCRDSISSSIWGAGGHTRAADGDPLLQVLDLSVVLRVGVDLDLALIGVQQLQLLLQLHPQHFVLRLLGLIQSQLKDGGRKEEWTDGRHVQRRCGAGVPWPPPPLLLTACVDSMSLMEWSYCSARMASLRVCSSFRRFSTALWSDLGVFSSRWLRSALYWRVWILQVSWN
ncbi:hypothetical protein EYF80_025636 [Liparis tanakae]|uniref:Uncharacterized protein n=1 Tax=Liparis tanakae TaxID=230148 RepID=A0A4Z2HE31_9TELE|nr:hypothetical protein EYF80_025636 [Liparis tanakae]